MQLARNLPARGKLRAGMGQNRSFPRIFGTLASMAGKKLQGQVALITGASRGVGAATAQLLAVAGAAVVLTA
ncbi:MAG: hypothetical protein JJ992_29890, partial [Planctomycetes bacterium]|nr:hypothetical protein [Planctomycetota bacterium]